MRKAMAGGVIGLAAAMVFAATLLMAQPWGQEPAAAGAEIVPLNVKPGLWQTHLTVVVTGLPPQMAAMANTHSTYRTCLKPEDLRNAKELATKELARYTCASLKVLKSTKSDMEVQGRGCSAGNGMTADGDAKFHAADPEHVTETLDVQWNGSTPMGDVSVHSRSNAVDQWIGASCPADVH